MLPTFITIIVIIAVLVLWIIATQSKLVVLDENISNAMSQIGVQLSSRFDALMALLDITKGYARHESETLIRTIKSERSMITAKATPEDVLRQEMIISDSLGRITLTAEQYPELKANKGYIQSLDAVKVFENMVNTSHLIYNDGVNKLNREIRMLPVSMIAGMLGFKQRDYLEDRVVKADNNSSVIVTPTTPDKHDSHAHEEIKVPGTVDSMGNVTVNVTDKTVTDALVKALAGAAKTGTGQNGITVVFRVDTAGKTDSNITV
jgi:LemA protein